MTLGAIGVFYGTSSQGLNASTTTGITTLDQQHIDLATSGRAKLVSFYSPDCAFSQRDTSSLNAIHKQFDKNKVDIIAVAMPYDTIDAISTFKQENDIAYDLAHDADGEIAASFPNVRFTPTTFLIDTEGRIIWRHTGRMDADAVSERLTQTVVN